MSIKLDIINKIPEAIVNIDPRDLYTILPNPTIIELKGKVHQPLFVSTLLHGNETSGFYALQKIFKKYILGNQELPRDLIILIGNIEAAKHFQRRLDNQEDYNRIWSGGDFPEHMLANQIIDYVKAKQPFACIDVHNNTGANPFYGCVNKIDSKSLRLAGLFTERIVYFIRPVEVLTIALNKFTTAVTIESGRSGNLAGIERVYHYIDKVLHLNELSDKPMTDDEATVYHSVARITVPDKESFNFNKQPSQEFDFTFIETFECLNFLELAEHTCLGWRQNPYAKLVVTQEDGKEISDDIFSYDDNEIRTKRPIIPSMFCTTEKIIRQDCLGYIMQRYTLD